MPVALHVYKAGQGCCACCVLTSHVLAATAQVLRLMRVSRNGRASDCCWPGPGGQSSWGALPGVLCVQSFGHYRMLTIVMIVLPCVKKYWHSTMVLQLLFKKNQLSEAVHTSAISTWYLFTAGTGQRSNARFHLRHHGPLLGRPAAVH